MEKRAHLKKDAETEVAVIGAGMAGILTAFLLQKAGKKVTVLEARRIASGQTKNTTAKITSQHGLIYHKLIQEKGIEKAKQYAAANQNAIEEYRRIIKSEGINCGFEEKSAYLYSIDEEKLKQETEAALSLGLPAFFHSHIDIPLPNKGAVEFKHQAQFNPLEFINALSQQLTIYEKTPVKNVENNTLITPCGNVKAEHIVFACHYPFINFPGMYFARMHQERSYVIALENANFPDDMYIGADDNSYSLRTYGHYLLFGGEGHRTGENSKGGRYEALKQKAEQLFPGCRKAAFWSAQDCITADDVPFIGSYSSSTPNWYVATGFKKWGMTSSMVSAMLIKDSICGIKNENSEVFSPSRFSSSQIPTMAQDWKKALKGLSRSFIQIPEKTAEELPVGHGGVVEADGEKVGVYKDENKKLHIVSIHCPHLGCQLEWNPDELSWDCPCHGSRFDFDGNLISGPAMENIN